MYMAFLQRMLQITIQLATQLYDFIASLFTTSRNSRNSYAPANANSTSPTTPTNPFNNHILGNTFTLQNNTTIRMTKFLAEGGFSFVYEASKTNQPHIHYAAKIMTVQTPEQRTSINREISTHNNYNHKFLLKLVDHDFIKINNHTLCLLLLPLLRNGSLRSQIDERLNNHNMQTPYPQTQLLELFRQICTAVDVLHNHGDAPCAHRDIKPENVLINSAGEPVLMDFGGVVYGETILKSRQDALQAVDFASTNSTMSYRAPELFEMGCSHYDSDPIDEKTDIWSLGCLLFCMAYGQSPFECEFERNDSGKVRVVECSYLRVIGKIPQPPQGSAVSKRYSQEVGVLINDCLDQSRGRRMGITDIIARIDAILKNNTVHNDLI